MRLRNWDLGFGILRVLAVVSLLSVLSLAQADGSQQNVLGRAGTFAIINARIVTVSGAVIENGTVLIQDGKIAGVGTSVQVPKGAETIDGKGLSVYPGMIDAATHMGLSEVPLGGASTVDVAEVGDQNANAKAILGINPNSSHVNVTRIAGITTVLSFPTGGTIAGQAAVINLWGSTQDQMSVDPTFGLVINFPRVAAFGGFRFGRVDFNELVRRRDQRLEELKKTFRDAEAYARISDAYKADKTLPAPVTDVRLEAMTPYIRGQKPVIFTAERERDILAVIKFVEEYKLKAIIVGGQEAWKAAAGLKKNNIAVIYTNSFNLPVQDDDAYDSLWEAPSKMAKAGIKFAISTGEDGGNVRDLPYQAGMTAGYGLSKDDALKAVTLYPAEILGIADKYGSIETGKMANIVVATGDLLEPRTDVKYLFINGRMIPLTSRHTELFERFKDRVK